MTHAQMLTSRLRICGYPELNFTIILNPHNGPGKAALPDANYRREIQRLNSLANVCTIGYVRVNYCKRELNEVCQDVTKYGGWAKDFESTGLAVHGIFIDETPNLYDEGKAKYLDALSQHVKDTTGILGDRLVRNKKPPERFMPRD
jgi:Spherulation-specific family 4